MTKKEEIINQFSPYCSQCNGLCCKRGVFTVFDWEAKKLSKTKEFSSGVVTDVRGTCKDYDMSVACIFYENDGCKLPVEMRPVDCLTYPFYPKLKEKEGEFEIDHFVIDTECPFHNEIANNKIILNDMQKLWKTLHKKLTTREINDWIGIDGNWKEWYKKAKIVKTNHKI